MVGRVAFGAVGKVGSVGRVGNGVESNGGSVALGRVGNGAEDNGGNMALGRVERVGRVGNGVAFGRVGMEGNGSRDNVGGDEAGVSNRWRAARLISKLDKHNAIRNDNREQWLKEAGDMV
ncbi:hypothetical protein Ddye_009619 [Dipteronia dyeriana]|uniref:Uncharacterized protein n=1 Tax=Dipteronia dyeriana TaxID=168575 RepID=A0AAD9XC45_9ROSI|nr:hypothetical protein Ddye_009619 [Dipteronia dyeriana]